MEDASFKSHMLPYGVEACVSHVRDIEGMYSDTFAMDSNGDVSVANNGNACFFIAHDNDRAIGG